MGRLIVRRLILAAFVVWGVTLVTFFLSRVVPGDPARMIAGPRADAAAIASTRHIYGLDEPLLTQYRTYIVGLAHGDLGISFMTRRPVLKDLRADFPATLELTLYALVFGVAMSLVVALIAARRRGSAIDRGAQLVAILGLSVPAFWLALLLQLVVGVKLGWLPLAGRLSADAVPPPHLTGLFTVDSLLTGRFGTFNESFRSLLLPSLALGFGVFGLMTRIIRASLVDVIAEDYVRTAEAKGLSRARILGRHVLRNAMLPAVTILGLEFGLLIGGVFVVEYIFAWPGIGAYAFNGFQASDYNAIMGVTLLVAVAYVLTNLAVDLAYLYLDPRIAYT